MRPHWFFLFLLIVQVTLSRATQIVNDISYAYEDSNSQKLDIHYPSLGKAPYPVVIWIHGGAFKSGTRKDVNAKHLASILGPKGIAVVSIGYRFSTQAKWPAQLHDSKSAIRWIRAHAETYQFDPERIAVAGRSAGGHLASMVGLTGDSQIYTIGSATMDLEGQVGGNTEYSSAVRAVASLYGPTNFLTLHSVCPINNPSLSIRTKDTTYAPESELIGGSVFQFSDSAKMASPVNFVTPDDPPFLLIHGNKDPLVVSCQSIELHNLLRQAFIHTDKETRLIQYSTKEHGFSVLEAKDSLIAFFSRHLLDGTNHDVILSKKIPSKEPKIWKTPSYIKISHSEAFRLKITDVQGKVLFTKRFEKSQPGTIHSIKLVSGQPGIRFCTLSDFNQTIKIHTYINTL